MILPDVNVLVYAFRTEAPGHHRYAQWLTGVVAGEAELALHDAPLTGFLRIVTHRRIVGVETPAAIAVAFVQRLTEARRVRWLTSGPLVWKRLGQLFATDPGVRANVVPDAHLAALAMVHGCRLATADRGFARFPGLTWFDPASS